MLVLSVLCGAGLEANGHSDRPSYRRTDPLTGQQLLCDRCPPGTRLRAHCTRSRQTKCAPCGAGLFTEFWNYIPDCLRCVACSDHQRVVQPCNATVDTVCECEEGFFWDQHFCRKHNVCKPGHGVKAPGDQLIPVINTVKPTIIYFLMFFLLVGAGHYSSFILVRRAK